MARAKKANGASFLPKSSKSIGIILDRAADLFSTRGFASTTLRQIAAKSNIKAGSIYYYFDSKEQILVEVLKIGISMAYTSVREAIDQLPQDSIHILKIETGIRAHLNTLHSHRKYMTANVLFLGQIPKKVTTLLKEDRKAYSDYWNNLLLDAQKAGEIREGLNISFLRPFILGSMNRSTEWFNVKKSDLKSLTDHFVTIILGGIAVTGSDSQPGNPSGFPK